MKTWAVAIRFLIVMTLLTGLIYPLLMTGLGQTLFPVEANGSLVCGPDGRVVGSARIAQSFKNPRYFFPRPSAVDFNAMSSGGSNLSPLSADLVAKIKERQKAGTTGDLLFTSGSGLDPEISPEDATSQIARVAAARQMPESEVRSMVEKFVEGRQFSFLGEPRVNVLKLNLALDQR